MLIIANDVTTKDTQSRKWQITINNPKEKNFSHERIKEELSKLKSLIYWCMSDEVGENEATYHTHIYIACSSAIRFSTLRRKFEGVAHLEIAHGTSEENRNYIFKIGKWATDKKHGTRVSDTQEEYGEMPIERKGARNDLTDLYDMIKSGMSNYEILENEPNYLTRIETIERVRQTIKEEQYKTTFRILEVIYIYGNTETGKTRGIMDKYGYENIYRCTDYLHPFDTYKGQDVIIFEEFRSSLRLSDMLTYLDGYPFDLPCRYFNRVACYTKAYIISNISLKSQYINVQQEESTSWNAFIRRIHKVVHYTGKNEFKEYKTEDYINSNDFVEIDSTMDCPFDL